MSGQKDKCPKCKGTGITRTTPCETCNGTGEKKLDRPDMEDEVMRSLQELHDLTPKQSRHILVSLIEPLIEKATRKERGRILDEMIPHDEYWRILPEHKWQALKEEK